MALKGKLMAMAHMPLDDKLLAAVGRVTVRHAFLDWTLNRTIKTLTGMTPEQADFAFAAEGSASLRRKVLHVAAAKLGKGTDSYKELKKLIDKCESATKVRNGTTHNIWVVIEGEARLLDLQHRERVPPLPKANELDELADRIHDLSSQLNAARSKGGFLYDALRKPRAASSNYQ